MRLPGGKPSIPSHNSQSRSRDSNTRLQNARQKRWPLNFDVWLLWAWTKPDVNFVPLEANS